ncbi:FtsK/SpoIIIE domain-containing protein [Alkaliphilus sp. B6464]|uniref:FtsK/SpoIIIE domain-containing protein n=1 Tax=Alkaliphilus sp. B6464 TaxID=2731219 RepID=UPI001BAB2618|nr:FtsK/SpoIIIE domain-containing protein [Alkaliphilus sp. B6464]QUH21060.1 DNA translocase FtsK [Alkaliphilus sp. B6464]
MNKKMSYTELGICGIAMGGIMMSWAGLPLLGYLFHGVGVGSILQGVYKGNNPYKKLFTALGLYIGKDNREYPILKERKQTKYGECLRFSVPTGLCTKDFEKHQVALKEYFRATDIKIKFNNGWILLELHKERLKDVYDYSDIETKGILEVPVAYGIGGLQTIDIAKGPHILIAGETGSGKSTVLRNIITYLIQKKSKHGIKLHLIDLKEGVEFSIFRKSSTVATFSKSKEEAEKTLSSLLKEVKRRYELFFNNDCVDIVEYNKKFKKKKLNYEVCIIDEFADLQNEKDSIALLEELLAKARACGIHFINSTQRPDSKILNGRIKANVPYVIGLKTMNGINSRIIIDQEGLEGLKGNGHTIIKTDKLIEGQCIYISANKARDIVRETYTKENTSNIAIFKPKEKKREISKVAEVKDFNFLEVLVGGKND